jgi:ADP-heptose:LPS heptosyltransferase
MRRLLIRPGAIGDVILCLPALEFCRADYTEVWVPRPTMSLIRFADRIRAIPDTGLDLLGVVESGDFSAIASFDSIYSWYGANRDDFRAAVRDFPFRFFQAIPGEGSTMHAADFFMQQVGGPVPATPRISTPCSREPVAIIHPFSGSPKKNWPLANFREVAARLDIPVRWCAGPAENLEEAVRIENLYDLAAWLNGAAVYIGNDSGITHLAAAAGAPVVAVFQATDPAVWAPRGRRVAICENPTVDEVLDAVHRIARWPGK